MHCIRIDGVDAAGPTAATAARRTKPRGAGTAVGLRTTCMDGTTLLTRLYGHGSILVNGRGVVGGRVTDASAMSAAEAEVLVAQVAADDHYPGEERLNHVDVERQHPEGDGQQRKVHNQRHKIDE